MRHVVTAALALLLPITAPAATVVLDATHSGWWGDGGFHDAAIASYATGVCDVPGGCPFDPSATSTAVRSFFVFDLSSVTGPVVAASLQLESPALSYVGDSTETLLLSDVTTPLATLVTDAVGNVAVYDDLGTGLIYGQRMLSAADQGSVVEIPLSAGTAFVDLNAALGTSFAIGGSLATGVGLNLVFASSTGAELRRLVLTVAQCGDGAIDGAETCDDGNAISGDGCSDDCLREGGFACDNGEPSVCRPHVPVASTKLIVVDKLATAGKAKVAYVAKDPAVTKGIGTGLGDISATLDFGFFADSVVGAFTIPPGASDGTSGWKRNDESVAKYVNKAAPAGPTGAKVAVVKPGKLLKLVGKSTGDFPFGPFSGITPGASADTRFAIQNGPQVLVHCSRFLDGVDGASIVLKEIAGGTGWKLVARNGAPSFCPF